MWVLHEAERWNPDLGAILISPFSQTARADLITLTGNLISHGSAVVSGDRAISDLLTNLS